MSSNSLPPAPGGKPVRHRASKIHRILQILQAGVSLNRFQAAEHGDSALNATISRLRAYGYEIDGELEQVKTRFGTARVTRYSIPGTERGGV